MANLHSLGDRGKVPTKGKPGDVYYHKSIVYLVLADGTLAPLQRLHDVFAQLGISAIVGPPGRDGRDGTDGKNGRDGKDGRDGTDGAKGEPGDLTIIGDSDLQAAVAKLRAQRAAALAKISDVLGRRNSTTATAARFHLLTVKKALEGK